MGQGLLDNVFAGENGLGNLLPKLFGGSGTAQATITYATNRTFDKKTRVETGSDETSYSCDMTPPTAFTDAQMPGASVEVGDLMTVIPSFQTPEKPPVKAELSYKGDLYSIEFVGVVTSGNEICNYRLQLRSI